LPVADLDRISGRRRVHRFILPRPEPRFHTNFRPGGRAATLEFVPNEDRISPPMAASFSLIMLMSTASGDAYTFSELKSMYLEAGFHDVTEQLLPRSPHTVVTGIA